MLDFCTHFLLSLTQTSLACILFQHYYQPRLRCFKRERYSTDVIPGCSGIESDHPGKDYCTRRGLWLSKVGDGGWCDTGEEMVKRPLWLCEGDCDEDEECEVKMDVYLSSCRFDCFLL